MIAYLFQKYLENFTFQLCKILQQFTSEIYCLKKVAYFLTLPIIFSVYKQDLKTKKKPKELKKKL